MSGKTTACQPLVVRAGYLKKLKTLRKKWFVLRGETCESSACLEYYDSEKKFNSGHPPKRRILLKTCFNINKRSDTKHKHVIALYTKDDCFCVVLDNEEDRDTWLKALLSLQRGEEVGDGEPPRPTFEHVWQMKVLSRGLGETTLLCGRQPDECIYRLCLTDKTLSLIRKDCEDIQAELSLSCIRSCGSLKNYFYLEVGRSSSIGAGELWMDAEDPNIAQNVHHTVLHAMSSNSSSKEDLGSYRIRSSSATESSKPNNNRRPLHSGAIKPVSFSQDVPQNNESVVIHPVTTTASTARHTTAGGGVSWPAIVNHQRTQSLPLANPAPLTDHTSHPPRATTKRSNQSSNKCPNSGGRERCDSMPSRPRTTSEGNHLGSWGLRLHPMVFRPQSLIVRDMSHSPPSESPVSPPSAACSTDSAGSSLSIDDSEHWGDNETMLGRYSNSLTPDEAIAEDDEHPDSPLMHITSPYVPMAPISSDDGYVDMSPRGRNIHGMSPAASTSSVTSGTPSTDMKFAEYHLEKVSSYFTPSEEEETNSTDRPIRANSVGSRPDYKYNKYNMEMSTTPENARVRAFSVGSRTKKVFNRVLPPYGYHTNNKSSSAPLLSNSRVQGSHGSIGPMDDLMELDFSKPSSAGSSGYVDMKPGFKTPSGYVEMKPGKIQDVSSYVDMRSGTPPSRENHTPMILRNTPEEGSYMDMDPKRNNKKLSPPSSLRNNQEYMDMTQRNNNKSRNVLSTSPIKNTKFHQGSPNSFEYMDMDFHAHNDSNKPAPDGYVEMTLGNQKPNHKRQSSLDGTKINSKADDYANMSGGSSRKKERKASKKDKTRSQPIAIQNTSAQPPKNSLESPVGRKYSGGTPPKMYLPLSSPYSSLPRQRSRQNSRRNSKDSSSSSVNTPSSSSTIFPISINSPCSPIKPTSSTTIKVPPAVVNTKYRGSGMLMNKSNEDYTTMNFEKPKVEDSSDYVNFNPGYPIMRRFNPREEENDYALMTPGQIDMKQTSPTIVSKLSKIGLCEASFRPINECTDLTKSEEGSPTTEKPETAVSRPSSTSSELSSSTSTVVGSRPNSVNSETVRPASITADVQLHYASLDLAPADEDGNRSPRTLKTQLSEIQAGPETGFGYAEIDFLKSEGFKLNSLPTNTRVKH